MKKTISKHYFIYTSIIALIISLILSSLISIYKINKLKNEVSFSAEILSKTIETSSLNLNILNLLSHYKLKIDIFPPETDIEKIPETKKTFTYSITNYTTTKDNYIIKITSFINILKIYFYTCLIFFTFNCFSALFYINILKKKIISPILNLSKNNLKTNTKYDLDEIELLKNYIKTNSTNMKNSISKLKIENKKITYILDNMSEGFLLIDKNLKVLTINKSAKKILNTKENSGKNIYHYTRNIKIINPIETAIKENKKINFDISLKNKKIYSTYIDKAKKSNSTSYEYIVLMVDVTVERQNQRMSQELFSNISHELKTPITSIRGYVELLQNNFAISPEQKQEFLYRIEKETQNIYQLINDILTISKLQNNTKNKENKPIEIYNLVEDIAKSLLPLCIEKNIKIENKCDKITINSNYKDFYKLFNNLILNAIKYNNKNGYVKISFKDQTDYFELIVKDSGIGISSEDKNRIFERFYRVEKGRKNTNPGSGLGLSIVKYIVKNYNGKIKVKSKLGNGSSFIVKLPKNKLL